MFDISHMTLFFIQVLRLEVLYFDVPGPANPECSEDRLLIYDGSAATSRLLGRYCSGNQPRDVIMTTSNTARIR